MNDKKLKFYHISRDASDERVQQFLEKGVAPAEGNGYGGQSKGFYCWTSETRANKYYASLLVAADADWAMENFGIDIRLKDGEALKIGVPVALDDITYPNWQIDNEQHPAPKRGRERSLFLDFWEAQKEVFQGEADFEIRNAAGEQALVYQLGWAEEKNCPILYYVNDKGEKGCEIVDCTNANYSSRTQAINDYLCAREPCYLENYNRLIQAVAQNLYQTEINGKALFTSDVALKYCADEPLLKVEVSKICGAVAYDAEKGERLLPESADEMAWGDYRLVMKEQKYSAKGLNVSKEMDYTRQKLGCHQKSGQKQERVGAKSQKEPKSAAKAQKAGLKLKMAQNRGGQTSGGRG